MKEEELSWIEIARYGVSTCTEPPRFAKEIGGPRTLDKGLPKRYYTTTR